MVGATMLVAIGSLARPALAEQIGAWTVVERVSPLTNAKTLSASTDSTEPLLNQINQPQKATFVLRCREGVRAAYVDWPQVLNAPMRSALLGLPQTIVLKKLDDGPITAATWVVADGGAAAGAFDNLGSPKIIASLHGAKRLVVRMTGQIQQDAVFDLMGIDEVTAKVEQTCGGGRVAALLPSVVESQEVAGEVTGSGAAASAALADALTKEGFAGVQQDGGGASAPMQPFKLTTRLADCGHVLGLPYLGDRRVQTLVAVEAKIVGTRATVRLTISAVMKTGMGAADKPLKCTSTGALERKLLNSAALRL